MGQLLNLPSLGIFFHIDKLEKYSSSPKQSASFECVSYGQAAWEIFWQIVDINRISGTYLYECDTNQTLKGIENVYCIALQPVDGKLVDYICEAMENSPKYQNVAASTHFDTGDRLASEPLLAAGHIDSYGNLVGEGDHCSLPALQVVLNMSRHKTCLVCDASYPKNMLACPNCGSAAVSSEKKQHDSNSFNDYSESDISSSQIRKRSWPALMFSRLRQKFDRGAGKRHLNIDNPQCFNCGEYLEYLGSTIRGGEVTTTGSKSAQELEYDLGLFYGSICFRCKTIFCGKCNQGNSQVCPQCGADTQPVFRKEIRKLSHQLR